MGWQLAVVGTIVLLAAVYLARRVWRTWRGSGCGGCGCGAKAPAAADKRFLIPLEQVTLRKRDSG